jgi:hypothetical protein
VGQVQGDERCGSSTGERDHVARGFTWRLCLQESPVVFMDIIMCVCSVGRTLDGAEWPLERISTSMTILKGGFVY